MQTRKLTQTLTVLGLAAGLVLTSTAQGFGGPRGGFGGAQSDRFGGAPAQRLGQRPTAPPAEILCADADLLDTQEALDLAYMREEEKLAHDLYTAFYDLWAEPVFLHIARSEQRHTNGVLALLECYSQPDPAAGLLAGEFSDPGLQALYQELLSRGREDLLGALGAAALVEETDIADLDEALAVTDEAPLMRLYQRLQQGSRNHLRAFVGKIEDMGVVYEAQFLDQETVDAIVDQPMERGDRPGRGGRCDSPALEETTDL